MYSTLYSIKEAELTHLRWFCPREDDCLRSPAAFRCSQYQQSAGQGPQYRHQPGQKNTFINLLKYIPVQARIGYWQNKNVSQNKIKISREF